MREKITSSRVRWDDWGEMAMWEVVASSETFTDAHVTHYELKSNAERESAKIVGKMADFEGVHDPIAYPV